MAGAVVEAAPTHGEDLQKRVPILPRSYSAEVTSPQTTLSVVKATTTRQQYISSELVSESFTGIKSAGKPFLTPRPSWPMTLKLKPSPHIDPQDPENHRNRHEEPPTSFYSCASGTGPPTSATPEYISTGLKQSSKASRRYARGKGKRERQQSDSESDDEPEPPGKSSKKKMCGTPGSTPKLACPFFMCCPHIHLRCGHSSFGRISYVVQHLERQHYESVKCDCPICGINFDTLSGRSEHLREQWCLRRNPILCAVTTERLEEIQSVSTNRSKTQHEKWVDIYKIIVGDSTPVPLPWCTDPREYFLRHFINYVSQSGDHTIFNTIMEDTGTPSQILSNYLADEQEPLQSSILQSLPTPNFLEFSVQASVSSIPEGTSMTPFQLHRPIISTPGSTVPESNEANMTNLEWTWRNLVLISSTFLNTTAVTDPNKPTRLAKDTSYSIEDKTIGYLGVLEGFL